MKLATFILVMLVSVLAVGIWSYTNGAGTGTIFLRVAATAIALQVTYFVLLVVTGLLASSHNVSRGIRHETTMPRRNTKISQVAHK
ncbi:MAG: hypothetical protein V3V25_11815 [Paracoccaceae bacterium]